MNLPAHTMIRQSGDERLGVDPASDVFWDREWLTVASEQFERSTDDGFFISVESWDPRFDSQATAALLEQAGAVDVELIDAG